MKARSLKLHWVGVALLAVAFMGSAAAQPSTPQSTDSIHIFRSGSRPAQPGPAEYFTGTVHVRPLFDAKAPGRTSGGLVSFEASARSAWHTHPLGQVLIIAAGTGRVQMWGGAVQEMREGDVIWIPPNIKHWHGAAPNAAMSHIAIQEAQDGQVVHWLEKVNDAQYNATTENKPMAQETKSTGPYADISPALDGYTRDVLFGQVWERPELSKRDRSLITVATLIAGYRTNELPYHLKFAMQNGVSEQELSEVITHLAFYAGWPAANTAVEVARKVFQEAKFPKTE